MKTPRPNRAPQQTRAILFLMLIVLVSGCGRDLTEYELDAKSFDSKTLQRIQSDTGIVLPASARGLNFHYTPPIDPGYAAKIEIPRSSKEQMMKTLSMINNNTNLTVSGALSERVTWWTPKGAKPLVDRRGYDSKGKYLHVVLVEEETGLMLYIEWATT